MTIRGREDMAIPLEVGDLIPDVPVRRVTGDGPRVVSSREALGGPRTVLFAVPGAFTARCSDVHLPGYQVRAPELFAEGATKIVCLAWNDAAVMAAWRKDREVGPEIEFVADGSGDFTRAICMAIDLGALGMGQRSRRYAAVLEDGVVVYLGVEPEPGVTVSGAEAVLDVLRLRSAVG